jgi:hypothetical protein
MLQPQLKIEQTWRLNATLEPKGEEKLNDLLRIEFVSTNHPPAEEILRAWPENVDQEVSLFRVLERALVEALEEARDVGLPRWLGPRQRRCSLSCGPSAERPPFRFLPDCSCAGRSLGADR